MARKTMKELQGIVEALGGTEEEMQEEMARQIARNDAQPGTVTVEEEEEESGSLDAPSPPMFKGVKWVPFKQADGMDLAWVTQCTGGVMVYMQTLVCTGAKGDETSYREYKADKMAEALKSDPSLTVGETRDGREFVIVKSNRKGDTYSSVPFPVKLWGKDGASAPKGADPTMQLKYTLTGNIDPKAVTAGRSPERVKRAGKR